MSLGRGKRDFVAFKDFLGIIDAFVLALGQYLGSDLLHWGGVISGSKWWQQQPPYLFRQLVVSKCLLDFV